jgi:sodium-independent sulfate anion transporter 11
MPYTLTYLFQNLVVIKYVCLSTGTLIVLALSLLTPYFYYIPRSTLAAVLISAVVFMIDWKILKILWKFNSK